MNLSRNEAINRWSANEKKINEELVERTAHKRTYMYGVCLVECDCGVWRIDDPTIPCWSHEHRPQMMIEAFAQLRQAIRNLGYEILHAFKIV